MEPTGRTDRLYGDVRFRTEPSNCTVGSTVRSYMVNYGEPEQTFVNFWNNWNNLDVHKLHTYNIYSNTTAKDIIDYITYHRENGGWLIIAGHSLGKEGWEPFSIKEYKILMKFINNEKISVKTIREVVQGIK